MIKKIISEIRQFPAEAAKNREKYIVNPDKHFTRHPKLTFFKLGLTISFLLKRSIMVELEDVFFKFGLNKNYLFTKSALSKARLKLNPVFFLDWMRLVWTIYEKHCGHLLKKWKGFRLIGVDGSKVYLFNTPSIKAYFGVQTNQFGERPMGHIAVAYDVLNDFVMEGKMDAYGVAEQNIVLPWLGQMPKDSLLLYDRLFPSAAFIYVHYFLGLQFVMRAKLDFNNEVKKFVASGEKQTITNFRIESNVRKTLAAWGIDLAPHIKTVTVRLVNVALDDGTTEVLITSLQDFTTFEHQDFKWLYAQRWGSETTYGRLKNIFKMEVFSGRTPQAVLQDLYATWFIYNLQSVFIRSLDPYIDKLNEQPKRKRKVQINRSVSLGFLKIYYVDLLFKPCEEHTLEQVIKHVQQRFTKTLTDDIKGTGRKNERKKKAKRLNGKHQTWTNYAPVI